MGSEDDGHGVALLLVVVAPQTPRIDYSTCSITQKSRARLLLVR
jgi:hypothetical protein